LTKINAMATNNNRSTGFFVVVRMRQSFFIL
jgi:hypothetical protein